MANEGVFRGAHTRVLAWKCTSCGDLVFSRAQHDMRYCTCKKIAVDGGLGRDAVVRLVGNPKRVEMYIEQTKDELYDDWNTGRNLYGLIRPH